MADRAKVCTDGILPFDLTACFTAPADGRYQIDTRGSTDVVMNSLDRTVRH